MLQKAYLPKKVQSATNLQELLLDLKLLVRVNRCIQISKVRILLKQKAFIDARANIFVHWNNSAYQLQLKIDMHKYSMYFIKLRENLLDNYY